MEISDRVSSTVTPPSAPSLPLGNTKSNTALLAVPLLMTLALLPAAPVVTVPIFIVAAAPISPCTPCKPRSPFSPLMLTEGGLMRPALFDQLKTPSADTLGTNTLTFSL